MQFVRFTNWQKTSQRSSETDMRKKEMKLIITFHTTADAMAMEKACKEQNVPGRIIPVPRAISAGCGLSWCANLDERDQIKAMMEKNGIQEENMHECLV